MPTNPIPIWTYLILLACQGSNAQSFHNVAEQKVPALIGDNSLGPESNPEMTLLESKRGTLLTKETINDGNPISKASQSTQWEDQSLNTKLMQQKLNEKAKLKSNLNIYTVGDSNGGLHDGGNHIGSDFNPQNQLSVVSQGSQSSSDSSKVSTATAIGSASLFQQIAAVSQMRNRHKTNTGGNGPKVGGNQTNTRGTEPHTGQPMQRTGGNIDITDKDLQHHLDSAESTVNTTAVSLHATKKKGSPRKTYYRRRSHRGHRRGHSMRARHRRSINTDYVSKRGKEVDFITAVKMSPAPPIVRVVPPDPIFYRHGRADEKLFSQGFVVIAYSPTGGVLDKLCGS
ncbi:hypothetical protein WDU94_010622 [Cyamophila willieti]